MKFPILFLFIASLSFSQGRIDTLYSEASLDGDITMRWVPEQFRVSTSAVDVVAGDALAPLDPVCFRGYFSFDLTDAASVKNISTGVLELYQYISFGDGRSSWYPHWDVPGGATVFCVVDHIIYGDSLDASDWYAGDPGKSTTITSNIGIISLDSINGIKRLDVTSALKRDLSDGRHRSQFRVRFPLLTDNDDLNDWLGFYAREAADLHDPKYAPRIIISSTPTSVSTGAIDVTDAQLSIDVHPNPFNSSTVVSVQVARTQQISIKIYDVLGRTVTTLADGVLNNARHVFRFDAVSVASGLYFVQVRSKSSVETKRTVVVK